MAVLVSLWGGLVGLCRGRYKRLDYAWTVMGVSGWPARLEAIFLPEPGPAWPAASPTRPCPAGRR